MSSVQQTFEQSVEQRLAALEQSMAELKAEPVKVKEKQSRKPKKAEAPEGGSASEAPAAPKEKREPSAWNIMVSGLVAEMKQSGWESWTDLKGVVWPRSRSDPVKDKKGAETGQSHYVYDGGDHDGKAPSPALGGMVRASMLKALADPEHRAKAEAYHAKLAEKRSQGSVGSGAHEEPVEDAPEAGAKKAGGRPKMTEEQKAAAKAKRDAKKAAATAAVAAEETELAAEEGFEEVAAEEEAAEEQEESKEEEEEEEDGSQTPAAAPEPPKASVGGGGSAAAAAPPPKSKFPVGLPKLAGSSMAAIKAKVVSKKLDLTLKPWTFKGKSYLTNERKDVVTTELEWVGRFNGVKIDTSVTEPADLGDAGTSE
jgi:hypothetical protein